MSEQSSQEEKPDKQDDAPRFKQLPTTYANNFKLDPNVWDIKLIFGELAKSQSEQQIDWRCSVTMPWAPAKILYYYLAINMVAHEQINGKIRIPPQVAPILPDPPADNASKQEKELFEYVRRLHSSLFGTAKQP